MTLIRRKAMLGALLLSAALAACDQPGPALRVTDLVIVAPLPGTNVSAAYLTLRNQSREAITVNRVSSPEFAKVEMHESMLGDDLIQMRKIDTVSIDAGASVKFEAGGRHLMLIGPPKGLQPGMLVSLHFKYNDGGLLSVSAPFQDRR